MIGMKADVRRDSNYFASEAAQTALKSAATFSEQTAKLVSGDPIQNHGC